MTLRPAWVRPVAMATFTAIAMAAAAAVLWWQGELRGLSGPAPVAVVFAAVVVVCLLMGVAAVVGSQDAHACYTAALAGLTSAQCAAAVTAVRRGPIPADQQVRKGAAALGDTYLDKRRRSRPSRYLAWGLVGGALALQLIGTQSSHGSVAPGLMIVLIPAALLWDWYAAIRIQRRVAALQVPRHTIYAS